MEEEYLKNKMQDIAKKIKEELPENFGFVLLTYRHNSKGELIYVSNSNREDVVEAMKEFIEKTKNNYGNDIGKY